MSDTAPSADRPPLLRVRDLSKEFLARGQLLSKGRRGAVRAVDGIDFTVGDGQTLSLVGESGCGKSTTARMLLDLETPSKGVVEFRGTPLRDLKGADYRSYRRSVQAVFQDPSGALSPRRRVRQLIAEPLVANKVLARDAVSQRITELLTAVGMNPAVAESFPHELSGGMRQRVAVAQALATKPALIVLDEPVSALDVSIRAQIMNLLKDIQDSFGVAYVLIAHDLATVRYLSHDVAAMYLGSIMETGNAEQFFTEALHPYTLALISAAVQVGPERSRERIILEGDTPSPSNPPTGCRFHTRCWLRKGLADTTRCETERPRLQDVGEGHHVACHFVAESASHPARVKLVTQTAEANAPLPEVPV